MKAKYFCIVIFFIGFISYRGQETKETIDIQEVEVTATRIKRKLREVPIITSIISSKTIEKSQIIHFKNFLEQELAGVSFSNHGNTSNINMMGLGAKYILFLIDGERMAGETFDNVDYSRININDIERIEIVKGAASSLYGSNAIGGVINIITRKPKTDLDANISLRFGSFNERQGAIFVGTNQKWGIFGLSAHYTGKDPYILKDKESIKIFYSNGEIKNRDLGETHIAGYYDYGVNPKITVNISPKVQLIANSNYYFKERNSRDIQSRKVRAQYQDYSSSGKLNIQLSGGKNLSISGSYGIYEKFDRYLLLKSKEKNYENSIWRASLIYDQKISKRHVVVLGGEFLSEELLSFMFRSENSKQSVQTYSVFTQQEWNVWSDFTIVTGGRYDNHSEYDGHFTWRLSGMYRLGKYVFRGGYSGGFRSPNLKELYTDWYHPYGGGFQILGNTSLKAEKSHNFNISADAQFKDLNITLVGQYSYIKDKINTVWNKEARDSLLYVNLDQAKILSAEFLVSYRFFSDLIIKGGYAFSHDFNERQQQTRPHTFTTRLEYSPSFAEKYSPMFSFSGKYFSGMDIYGVDTASKQYRVYYEPYSIWRMVLSLKLPLSFQFSAGIDNLFDYKPNFSSFYSSVSIGRAYFIGIRWDVK